MSGNPNLQKMGKRKAANTENQPDWLFPATKSPTSLTPQEDGRSKTKQEKRLAEELLKRRASGEPPNSIPPPELVALVGTFLLDNEFSKTSKAFKIELKKKGTKSEGTEGLISLSTIYNEWQNMRSGVLDEEVNEGGVGAGSEEDESSSSDSEGSSSSASEEEETNDSDVEMEDATQPTKKSPRRAASSSVSSSASSSSDSDADDEDEGIASAQPQAKVNNLKRKALSSSSSSTSGSDSSSEDEAPQTKKIKVATASSTSSSGSNSISSSDESSGSDSSSEEDSSAGAAAAKHLSESESSSEDEGDSDSDSESSTNSTAQKVPLPKSDSESSSSDSDSTSDSSSESEPEVAPKQSSDKAVASDTSATLSDGPKKSDSSSDSDSASDVAPTTTAQALSPPLPPTPIIKGSKKQNVPFSRIPKDIKVDNRLASNAYVPYDYAQRAHEDLIVTKGKGFTKEKNKKKRGSYRGGYIDVEGKKGIKFED